MRIKDINIVYLSNIIKDSKSFAEIIRKLELAVCSSSYRALKRRINKDNINISHISVGLNSNSGRKFNRISQSFAQMVNNPNSCRGSIKKAILKENLLENKCSICYQEPIFNEKPLVMILDHINGIRNDNRLENLRFVCPNCNSQLDTFSGRNLKRQNFCLDCGKKITNISKRCFKCASIKRGLEQRKVINRPSLDELESDIDKFGYRYTGKKYGVSDAAIKKWKTQYIMALSAKVRQIDSQSINRELNSP